METFDEREGLPSASIMERLSLCPGSWNASRRLGLPEIQNPQLDEWAEAGDRIHLWLENHDLIELSPDELAIARKCEEERDRLVYQVFPDWDRNPGRIVVEHRAWLKDDEGKACSAKLDFCAVAPDRKKALVVDYKSNRGDHAASDSNIQLQTQVVIAWHELNEAPDAIYTAVVQPLIKKPLLCLYDRPGLVAATNRTFGILEWSRRPDAPLRAGKRQCQYCPARFQCQVAWKGSVESVASTNPAFLSPEDLSKRLDQWQLAKVLGKELDTFCKARLKKGDTIPNWQLKDTGSNRTVPNAYELFKLAKACGLVRSPNEFIKKFCKVTIGSLPEENLDALAGAIKSEPKEQSLQRITNG